MTDRFEARLADLLADRLAGHPELAGVQRLRDGLSDAGTTAPRATVAILSAAPSGGFDDDRPEVFGGKGERATRPVLRLAGEVMVRVRVGSGAAPGQREALVRALDRLLLVLNDEEVRAGRAFDTGTDRGFALDGFRLARIATDLEDEAFHRTFDLVYGYAGRFWPVEDPVVGAAIVTVPMRIVVQPVGMGDVVVHAGAAALEIPLVLDLRAVDGAEPRLAARLRGAEPPGTMVGDATGLPTGFVAVPDAVLRYQPPATLTQATRVEVELRFAGEGSGWGVLATFPIRVLP